MMIHEKRLLWVLAHPDDESLGNGGAVAKYAAEGAAVHLVCATRGERGRYFDNQDRPTTDVVAKTREAELRAAAEVLGIREVTFLDYIDADLDKANPSEVIAKIVAHIRRIRPHVVLTFGLEGGYGHPDHIAICQFTTAACMAAASSEFSLGPEKTAPHQVQKLYYMQFSDRKMRAYQEAFKKLVSTVDGDAREWDGYPEWYPTTIIDTKKYWPQVWKAIQCHKTQLTIYDKLATLPKEHHEFLWGTQEYYRVYSLVNGGRTKEHDLFEGIADR